VAHPQASEAWLIWWVIGWSRTASSTGSVYRPATKRLPLATRQGGAAHRAQLEHGRQMVPCSLAGRSSGERASACIDRDDNAVADADEPMPMPALFLSFPRVPQLTWTEADIPSFSSFSDTPCA